MDSTWWVKPEDLDEDQQKIVALDRRGSHLIVGPPGSGKTNLLLLRAKHLWLAGERHFLMIVFTRALQEFIRSGAQDYKVDPALVVTANAWQLQQLRTHELEPVLPEPFHKRRDAITKAILAHLDDEPPRHLYDVILLDEAQDYTELELELFRRLSRRRFAVADSRQRIFGGPRNLKPLISITADPLTLHHHYRCGMPICELADRLSGDSPKVPKLADTCNYRESDGVSTVDRAFLPSLDAQLAQVLNRLRTQIKAYRSGLLGVISPCNDEAKVAWQAIQASELGEVAVFQNFDEGYVPFRPEHRICVCSVHSAKGLEFRALHVVALDTVERHPASKRHNMYYTAITRAKTSLSLYHSGSLPGYVESAIAAGEPRRTPPTLSQLFEG